MKSQPVLTAASIAGVISAGISFARLMGWITLSDEQYNALMVFVGLLLPIVAGLWAERQTTPLSDPRDTDNVPLVRPDNSRALKAR